MSPVLKGAVLFLLLWQFWFGVSNAGLNILLLFIYHLLKVIKCDDTTFEKFPKDLLSARRTIVGDSISFTSYVVCPKCHAIYDYNNCLERLPEKSFISRKCKHVMYPQHKQLSKRQPCNAGLLQKVKVGNAYKFKPYKVYNYNSLMIAVERLVMRKGFLELCEEVSVTK